MKANLIYSGKGGVGKSTITYGLYMALKNQGKNVVVLDMDINTPSMHLLIKDRNDLVTRGENLPVFTTNATIELFIREAIKEIKKKDPEVLLIDTPPSITEVHQALIKKLNISSVVLVSQPTELSKSDVQRTVPFFVNEQIAVLGIVENMVRGEGLDYDYDLLGSIPMGEELNTQTVYANNQNIFEQISDKIMSKDVQDVIQENKLKSIFDESLEWEDVKHILGIIVYDEDESYVELKKNTSIHDIKFVNLKTWPIIHSLLENTMNKFRYQMGGTDLTDPAIEATPERMKRLVNAFREADQILVMITKNPNTEIPTMIGEMGQATLHVSDSYHGIPRVHYQTKNGPVVLFPHEIVPVTEQDMVNAVLDGYKWIDKGTRFVPPLNVVKNIVEAFGGKRVGMPETEEAIEKLYNKIVN